MSTSYSCTSLISCWQHGRCQPGAATPAGTADVPQTCSPPLATLLDTRKSFNSMAAACHLVPPVAAVSDGLSDHSGLFQFCVNPPRLACEQAHHWHSRRESPWRPLLHIVGHTWICTTNTCCNEISHQQRACHAYEHAYKQSTGIDVQKHSAVCVLRLHALCHPQSPVRHMFTGLCLALCTTLCYH